MKAKRIIRTGLALLLSIQLVLASSITALAAPEWPSDTGIMADMGIVIDADSGAVLFGQGIHIQSPPASITKLLTALVTVENANLDDMVTFSHDAVYNVESGSGNKKNIEEGDVLSVRDCLYLLLLQSSNQAANALAEHVAGSREAFVDMMNEKVRELGCVDDTHFANPSGLNDDSQHVSAYDMALISKAAFDNPQVFEIAGTKSYKLAPTINNPNGATCNNEHRLLITEDETSELYCPSAKAGKTGYTSLAGNTLVTCGEQDGRRVISVILKGQPSPNYFLDGKNLLEFGFDRFQNLSIPDNETRYVSGEDPVSVNGTDYSPSDLEIQPDTVITVPKDASFQDASLELVTELPENHPDRAVALLQYTYNDRKIGQAYLMQKESAVPASGENGENADAPAVPAETDGSSGQQSGFSLPKPSLMGVSVFLIILAAVLLGAYTAYSRKKEAEELRRRRERRMQRLREENYTEEEFFQLLDERKRLAAEHEKSAAAARHSRTRKKKPSRQKETKSGTKAGFTDYSADDFTADLLDSSRQAGQAGRDGAGNDSLL